MLTRTDYELLVYTLPSRCPAICLSTLILAPPGLDTARLTGLVAFDDDLVLCVHELTYDPHFDLLEGMHQGLKITKALPFLWKVRGDEPPET